MSKELSILAPLSSLRVSRFHIPAHGSFPNTSLAPYPLYIYHRAFLPSATTSTISAHLAHIGIVEPQWTYPMYITPHFHSTTHELLVLSGSALLQFGGPNNPDKVEIRVEKGDVMIIPAGVAHAMVEDGGGFMMLGCYPKNAAAWDHCTDTGGKSWGEEVEERIKELSWFERDPIYEAEGPVLEVE